MEKKYTKAIYLGSLLVIVVLTYSLTWLFLTKVDGDSDIYKYGVVLTKELYSYKGNTYYYGPKDESSKLINYNNAIVKRDKKDNTYKLIISLNDEENTLMKDNYLFYKNYFYLLSSKIVIYDLNKSNPEKTKKVKEGFFTGNASISGIYGVKKDWIYIRVKLYREKDNDKWYSEKYYKIKYDGSLVYEIPKKLIPKFKK